MGYLPYLLCVELKASDSALFLMAISDAPLPRALQQPIGEHPSVTDVLSGSIHNILF